MATYQILRFSLTKRPKKIASGLTLEEAQAHCRREDTHKIDNLGNVIWFDGYTTED